MTACFDEEMFYCLDESGRYYFEAISYRKVLADSKKRHDEFFKLMKM